MMITSMFGLMALLWLGGNQSVESPMVEKYLYGGKFAEGERALQEELRKNQNNDQARFGLGTLQFIRSVEHLGQSLYRFGLRNDGVIRATIPFLRLPVPNNPKPVVISCTAARRIMQDLIDDLSKAEKTLAAVSDDAVKLPLRFGLIRLDITGEGASGQQFDKIVAFYLRGTRNFPPGEDWLVVFDKGDVAWLRGYCHLLIAMAETALCYDWQEIFECTGHFFFHKVESPHLFLQSAKNNETGFNTEEIFDLIAFIHLVRLPVRDSARMKVALTHLEQMIALSKESWKAILAETDDDHEWLPNPRQKGVLGVAVRTEMIESWLEFMREAEVVLAGKRLLPFWRGNDNRGVNLKRIFTEPKTLDLVLWVQGTAASPYLENGPITLPGVRERLGRVFGGQFMGFAFWFN